MITVVGGVYREICLRPEWDEFYGSAGRAASSLRKLGVAVDLHTCVSDESDAVLQARSALEGFRVHATRAETTAFRYIHGLSTPQIQKAPQLQDPLEVKGERVLAYGMLETTPLIDAETAVYDPQNTYSPTGFKATGSQARRLALVLNRNEARRITGLVQAPVEEVAHAVAQQDGADVVVIKQGPMGALVWDQGTVTHVPAYQTPRVWKIGSGDQFAAVFAEGWMEAGLSAHEAAERASRATAYFCTHRGFPTSAKLDAFKPKPLPISEHWRAGGRRRVYLAAPFFTLGELWIVEQLRQHLMEMGLEVFSPYHDVGYGSAAEVVQHDLKGIEDCDLILAVADGTDCGTIFEVGYGRARGRPVIIYTENPKAEDLKMMDGSNCSITDDFVSAVYRTVWMAAEQ